MSKARGFSPVFVESCKNRFTPNLLLLITLGHEWAPAALWRCLELGFVRVLFQNAFSFILSAQEVQRMSDHSLHTEAKKLSRRTLLRGTVVKL